MKITDIQQITEKIKYFLEMGGSHYFNIEHGDSYIKIRVSDHSAKKQNNGDTPTLSFISATCNQGYSTMFGYEWVVDNIEDMITNTYENVSEILEWEFSQIKL